MSEKKHRLRIIKKLIKENKIDSQEKLLEMLEARNVTITQATLSRDLKLLKVSKVSDGSNGYYYSLLEEELQKVSEDKYIMDINRGFLSINFSYNLRIFHSCFIKKCKNSITVSKPWITKGIKTSCN